MANRLIIGIDPGISGGLGVVSTGEEGPQLFPTPTTIVTRGKRKKQEYNVALMQLRLRSLLMKGVKMVVIERGGTRPGQHAMAVYNTGYGCGLWHGLLAGLAMPHCWVQPVAWKRYHGLLKCDKRASRLKVQELWPLLAPVGPALEGAAEGLLMAEYLRTKESKEDNENGNDNGEWDVGV